MFRKRIMHFIGRHKTLTFTASQRADESDVEFEDRYATEEKAYFAKFGITV